MAHIPERWDGPNEWYFVTVVTRNREPVFAAATACEALQAAFREVYRYHPHRVAALVILPDHWHALIHPQNSKPIERIVGAVKQNVLRRLGRLRDSFWQPRFLDHRIRNAKDFETHRAYIYHNPIKHEYATEPGQWPYCFIHPYPFR